MRSLSRTACGRLMGRNAWPPGRAGGHQLFGSYLDPKNQVKCNAIQVKNKENLLLTTLISRVLNQLARRVLTHYPI